MQLHKAIRHLVLAEASYAAGRLRSRGLTGAAGQIEQTADSLEFAPAGPDAAGIAADEERVTGRAVTLTLRTNDRTSLTRVVPAADFSLYSRDAGALLTGGADARAAANALRASAIFQEFHAARLGAPLDSSVVSAFAVPSDPAASAVRSSAPLMSMAIIAALIALSAAMSVGAIRVIGPLSIAATWWVSRRVFPSETVAVIAAAVTLLWMREPAASAIVALIGAMAIGACLESERANDSTIALCWSVAGGVAAGALISFDPAVGGVFVAGLLAVWSAGVFLFMRFRPALIAGLAAGVLVGALAMHFTNLPLPPSPVSAAPFLLDRAAPAVSVALPILLGFAALCGSLTGVHRYALAMMLPIVLMAVGVVTAWSRHSMDAAGLSVAFALAITLSSRAIKPLLRGQHRARPA